MKNQNLPEGVKQSAVDFTLDAFTCKDIPEWILDTHSNEKFSFENFLKYQKVSKRNQLMLHRSIFSTLFIGGIAYTYLRNYEQSVTATQIICWVFAAFFPVLFSVVIEATKNVLCAIKDLDTQAYLFCQHYSDFISEIALERCNEISDQTRLSARKFIAIGDTENTNIIVDKRLTNIAMRIIEEESDGNPLENRSEHDRQKMKEFSTLLHNIYKHHKTWGTYFKRAYFELGQIPPKKLINDWRLTDEDLERIKKRKEEIDRTEQLQTTLV